MKKTDKDKLLKKLSEKFERIEDAHNALDKNSNVTDSLYFNFLTYISEYVDFIQKNPFLKKLNIDLLKLKINEQGNYPKTAYGYSYKKINKLNLVFSYKEDNRPLPKSKWNKPPYEVLKFTKAQRIQRINYKLLKQLERGTYNGNNPFRPALSLELFEHTKKVHRKLLDSAGQAKVNKANFKFKSFDSEEGILKIGDFKVPFSKTSRPNKYAILRALFDDGFKPKEEDVFYSELHPFVLLGDRNRECDEKLRRAYAKSFKDINEMILEVTDFIGDLFIKTSKYVRINSKYL
jgi:hypothetical protein